MDKLVKDLLDIEQTGNEGLAWLDEERVAHAQQLEDEIAHNLQEIKRKTGQVIEDLKRDAKIALAVNLAEIETEHRQKAAQLNELFAANAEKWRSDLTTRVLNTLMS